MAATSTTSSTTFSNDDVLGTGTSASGIGSDATTQAAGAAHDAIASADRKADAMLDRLVKGAHETIDRLAEKAAPLADRLGQSADSASQTLRAKADDLSELQQEWMESMRSAVRENPLTAVLAAAAIGVIVAKLTSSSR